MNTTPTDLADLRPRRQILDRLFRVSTLAAGALILVVLVLIAWTISGKSLPVFRDEGISFFTERRWAPSKRGVRRAELHLRHGRDGAHRRPDLGSGQHRHRPVHDAGGPAVAEEVAGLAHRSRRRRALGRVRPVGHHLPRPEARRVLQDGQRLVRRLADSRRHLRAVRAQDVRS